jgi:hypothetical protein
VDLTGQGAAAAFMPLSMKMDLKDIGLSSLSMSDA